MPLLVGCEPAPQNDLNEPTINNTATIQHYNWMNNYAHQHNLTNVVCRQARSYHDDMDVCTAESTSGVKIRVAFWGNVDVMPFSTTKDPL